MSSIQLNEEDYDAFLLESEKILKKFSKLEGKFNRLPLHLNFVDAIQTAGNIPDENLILREVILLSPNKPNHPINEAFSFGEITEIFGDPGTGKSKIAIQVLGSFLKSNSEEYVVFVDSEGTFPLHMNGRIHDFSASQLQRVLMKQPKDCGEYDELLTNLPSFVKNFKNIKLIIIDSFTILYKNSDEGLGQIKNVANNILRLVKMAKKLNVCVF